MDSRLPLRLARKWTSQSQKTLRQIFQNFVKGFLVTRFGNLLATHSSRNNRMFCTNRVKFKTVLKTFQFSHASRAHTLSCPPLPLIKPPFSLTKPPFSSSILHQSSRKCMGFLLFSKYFKFLALVFLILCIC